MHYVQDSGDLYAHVREIWNSGKRDFLMIETMSVLIFKYHATWAPDMYMRLRPKEFAGNQVRFRRLIEENELVNDVSRELTLGLVVQHNFSPIRYPRLTQNHWSIRRHLTLATASWALCWLAFPNGFSRPPGPMVLIAFTSLQEKGN